MTETLPESLTLPVLPLDDDVVLPTMVVPLDASDPEVRAPVAAATTAAEGDAGPRVLLVPRIGGKYAPVGTLGVVEQEGRLPNGKPGVVVRGLARVRIGAGTVGPGAALWVHGTVAAEPPAAHARPSWRASTVASRLPSCKSAAPGRWLMSFPA